MGKVTKTQRLKKLKIQVRDLSLKLMEVEAKPTCGAANYYDKKAQIKNIENKVKFLNRKIDAIVGHDNIAVYNNI